MTESKTRAPFLVPCLAGRCPRCGKGPLFKNVLELRPLCARCGLDYKFIDTGDGPAVFVILILGFVALGGALIMHLGYGVPQWQTYLFWAIATPLLALGLLRILKAALIWLQFRHEAEQGRLAKD